MKIKLSGIGALINALNSETVNPRIKEVVKKNGADMHQKALELVPVDTGTLKRSITLEIKDGGLTAEVKEHTEYGVYLELGTRYMAAQPYMRPALNFVKDKFRNDLKKAVDWW